MARFTRQGKVKIAWTANFAYAIGLFTADGYLSSDQRHLVFTSKDADLIETFKRALGLQNNPTRFARGGEKEKKYYHLFFGDKNFYQFLNTIGLFSAKSKTIKAVDVPDAFFSDFLRGLFDGDGTIYSFKDRRWIMSIVFQISFASASIDFLSWLQKKLAALYSTKGFICKGAGVYNLRYVKGTSRKILEAMYENPQCLHLKRKFDKVQAILEVDKISGKQSLQKPRNAAVAQW